MKTIHGYWDFIEVLRDKGFCTASSGICSLSPYYGEEIAWHTEDPDTDPWEWRLRVLEDFDDIAYGKFFGGKGGFITREFLVYFLALRRGGATLEQEYQAGTVSRYEKKIYEAVRAYGCMPLHEIKRAVGMPREDKARFDRALTALQMKLYMMICGTQQKVSKSGEAYGWSSTVFCTPETYFGEEILEEAERLAKDEAQNAVWNGIMAITSEAGERAVRKFIFG